MPIYEYRCQDCRRLVSVWVRRMGQDAERCPQRGGRRLTRLVSRFALAPSDESRLGSLADDAGLASVDENDPQSAARFLKRMGSEPGEDGGPELDQAIDEIERGGANADTADDSTATV